MHDIKIEPTSIPYMSPFRHPDIMLLISQAFPKNRIVPTMESGDAMKAGKRVGNYTLSYL